MVSYDEIQEALQKYGQKFCMVKILVLIIKKNTRLWRYP